HEKIGSRLDLQLGRHLDWGVSGLVIRVFLTGALEAMVLLGAMLSGGCRFFAIALGVAYRLCVFMGRASPGTLGHWYGPPKGCKEIQLN
ncbi:MAG: hypothetical protein ACHRHE_24260, partial [Tepidisphaerales bacterium]